MIPAFGEAFRSGDRQAEHRSCMKEMGHGFTEDEERHRSRVSSATLTEKCWTLAVVNPTVADF